jgi:UDP-2,3-diacylglucosamine hydrolase
VAGPKKIGLIAGGGSLPLLFAQRARKAGYSLVTVAVKGAASSSLIRLSDAIHWVSIGQVGSLVAFFKRQGVHQAVFHGKVSHASLFKGLRLDWTALKLWASLKDRSGESLLKALAGELGKNGVKVLDGRFLMKDLLAPKGLLTRTKPSKEELKAATRALGQAKILAKSGIGQSLLAKKGAVVAVEGMEGTDVAILRAGKVAGPGCILAKAASPRHDWRFDIPTFGPKTLQSLARAKARGVVLEAGRCFLLDRDDLVREADRKGIFILSI